MSEDHKQQLESHSGTSSTSLKFGFAYPEVVAKLRAVYDKWWIKVQPRLVNEDAYEKPPAK